MTKEKLWAMNLQFIKDFSVSPSYAGSPHLAQSHAPKLFFLVAKRLPATIPCALDYKSMSTPLSYLAMDGSRSLYTPSVVTPEDFPSARDNFTVLFAQPGLLTSL